MATYSAKPSDVTRQWYLVDASQIPLGRMSTRIATMLTGKEKPIFTKHIDCGDYVVVINAENLVATGNKMADKKYYRHSQYPGSLKEASLSEMIQKDPAEVIRLSVKGMLPKNKLMDDRLIRLKIFVGDKHGHEAQKPVKVSLA
ncbi:MAG: 50S ribosomal protein L13 [Candidatus Saccharibacteria bacterium]